MCSIQVAIGAKVDTSTEPQLVLIGSPVRKVYVRYAHTICSKEIACRQTHLFNWARAKEIKVRMDTFSLLSIPKSELTPESGDCFTKVEHLRERQIEIKNEAFQVGKVTEIASVNACCCRSAILRMPWAKARRASTWPWANLNFPA